MLTNTSSSPPAGADESSLFRFVFVRHPLRRLVSAYLSKVAAPEESDERDAFLRPFLRFLRRRSQAGRLPPRATFGFPDFVDFVAEEVRRGTVSYGTLHWVPFTKLCGICENRCCKLPFREGTYRYLH